MRSTRAILLSTLILSHHDSSQTPLLILAFFSPHASVSRTVGHDHYHSPSPNKIHNVDNFVHRDHHAVVMLRSSSPDAAAVVIVPPSVSTSTAASRSSMAGIVVEEKPPSSSSSSSATTADDALVTSPPSAITKPALLSARGEYDDPHQSNSAAITTTMSVEARIDDAKRRAAESKTRAAYLEERAESYRNTIQSVREDAVGGNELIEEKSVVDEYGLYNDDDDGRAFEIAEGVMLLAIP
eukprot:CAMPEP_0181081614 /NCGR_PEP_ID=MMETSP1071-20121207/3191_1 /TAXON_ID=35127 /ORGANISM="Thalassiosira sp., Strain NH16" /LENGTH=239 /DNA_ID=CAMNT_0023163163 /DNA_START=14 /DNA_END=729 /DNA_ORIENTATION=+